MHPQCSRWGRCAAETLAKKQALQWLARSLVAQPWVKTCQLQLSSCRKHIGTWSCIWFCECFVGFCVCVCDVRLHSQWQDVLRSCYAGGCICKTCYGHAQSCQELLLEIGRDSVRRKSWCQNVPNLFGIFSRDAEKKDHSANKIRQPKGNVNQTC